MSELIVGNITLKRDERLDIIGPCAAQSEDQVMECAAAVKRTGVRVFRACTFKPRTAPSAFEGVGSEGYPWLARVTREHGLVVATELEHGDDVRRLAEVLFEHNPNAGLVVWVGSRNTHHPNVRSIGKAASEYPNISVGHKNPMTYKSNHTDWIGLVDHLRSGGIADNRVVLVHRGFCNELLPNPHGLVNVPVHEIAMNVSERTGLPIIMDLSHPAKVSSKVELVAREATQYPYRGLMIEAATPRRIEEALTDRAQHVTIEEAGHIIQRDIERRALQVVERAA